jgi:siroheme synthase (precorrin-2 oxidase/ferrochelatase)
VSAQACTYCGVLSDTTDHVPARSIRAAIREHLPNRYVEVEVPACLECNSAIGARGLTLVQRREIAKRAIEKKYRQILALPAWNENELDELGPELHKDVECHAVVKKWVKDRLAWSR